jgi:hypothetical protein
MQFKAVNLRLYLEHAKLTEFPCKTPSPGVACVIKKIN